MSPLDLLVATISPSLANLAAFVLVERHWYMLAAALLVGAVIRRKLISAPTMTLGEAATIVSFVGVLYFSTVLSCITAGHNEAVECLRQQHGFFLVCLLVWIPVQTWNETKRVLWPPSTRP